MLNDTHPDDARSSDSPMDDVAELVGTAGLRLDAFLAQRLPDLSRAQCQRLIRAQRVQVNGRIATKPSLLLQGGEKVTVRLPSPSPPLLTPEAIPIAVLYEDDDLLVVSKPRGMVVHPGAGVQTGTLVHALLALGVPLSDIAGADRRGIVHRLDKGTSGVMVVAKTNFAHLHLAHQFACHVVDKRYLAVVVGTPTFEHQIIAAPLQRHPNDPERFTVARRGDARSADAVTEVWVRERYDKFALLEVRPITGRTHQIRVHLQHAGLPIVGDATYGGRAKALQIARDDKREDWVQAIQNLNGFALHAWRIGFTHPRTGERVTVTADVPDDMMCLLTRLRQRVP